MIKLEQKLISKIDKICKKNNLSYELIVRIGSGTSLNIITPEGEREHHGGLDWGMEEILHLVFNLLKKEYGKN